MKGNLNVYYDEEGDFLEIQVGEAREGYFEEIQDGIFERKDKETDDIIGIALFNVRKRRLEDIKLPVQVELSS